jgi:hypothetical protein
MKNYIANTKKMLKSIWLKLRLYLVIPPSIVFTVFLLILALFNIFGIRELGLRYVQGEVPKSEQNELIKKLTEIVNHFSFIFYILLLTWYLYFS